MNATEISDRLSLLSKGLLFPSESEYPLEPFIWEKTTLSIKEILIRSGKNCDTPIATLTLEDFFASVVTEENWFDTQDREIAHRFRDLKRAIASNLENVQVFRVGKVEIEVYIVGTINSDLVGLKTTVIET